MLHTNALYHADADDLLERLPTGTIDLVYFDPPWPDDIAELPAYRQFIVPKLQQAYRILADTGNLFLHFYPLYACQIRLLLDNIFGERNFRNQYILPLPFVRNDSESPRPNYTVILFYGKSRTSVYHPLTRPYTKSELRDKFHYEDQRGRYRLESLLVPKDRPAMRYEWHEITPPAGYSWRFSAERMNQFLEEGIISLELSGRIPSLRRYATDTGALIGSVWNDLSESFAKKTKEENTGYVSQQPVDLLRRVIQIGSNTNGVVLDPFCGSGTTLIAAEQENRRWIGCDVSQQAYRITSDRLQVTTGNSIKIRKGDKFQIGRDYHSAFVIDDVAAIDTDSAESQKLSVEWRESQTYAVRPLVFTEGQSDWKHLKAAYQRLKESGFLDEQFELDFDEQEENRGDTLVLARCEWLTTSTPERPNIFIFDNDVDETVKKVTDPPKSFKTWGRNVFSFALPLPSHRNDPRVSIEFYYRDEDLMRKDSNGRRLFLSTEFDSATGFHKSDDLYCRDLNALRTPYPKIIDQNVAIRQERNLALSKNRFAEYILRHEKGFDDVDLAAFQDVFDKIRAIMDAAQSQTD